MAMKWKKKMGAFYYASPPPPPPPPAEVVSPPQASFSYYYAPSPPAPASNVNPLSSPPPPPPPLDVYSPPPQTEIWPPPELPPLTPIYYQSPPPPPPSNAPPPLSPPPPALLSHPPDSRLAAPPQTEIWPPPELPPLTPIYYQSPPPPPPSNAPPPLSPPPPALLSHPPDSRLAAPPPKAISPAPMPPRIPPPSAPSSHRNTTKKASTHSFSNSSKGAVSTAESVATFAVVAGLVILSFVGAAVWLVNKRKKPVRDEGGDLAMASSGSLHMSEASRARSPAYPLVRYGSEESSYPFARHGSEASYGFPYSPSGIGLGHTKLCFTLEELSAITNNFSIENILGEGGSGCVYKGCLRDGREVAVKQLKVSGAQGERQLRAEVEAISRAHHRHLVSLIGYCVSENRQLLVYDYVPNQTLYYHLHRNGRPMEWTKRIRVASGAAHGIAYLHEDCKPRIIHGDIKSSNILLDYNFEAQVSDFGLARSATDGKTHVSTSIMGTFGYLAPEYATSGKLTAKSDVYSFGMVLLELITGRKTVDTSQPLGDESLAEWARPLLIQALESKDVGHLPDPRLEGNYSKEEMFCMIEVAAACTRRSAAMRPQMSQVVTALDGLADLDINNGVQPGQSQTSNSSLDSEEIRMFQRMGFGSQDCSSDHSQTTNLT